MSITGVTRKARAFWQYKAAHRKRWEHSCQKNIRVMPRLSQVERERAVGMAQKGATNAAIARTFGCTKATVGRLMQPLRRTGSTADRSRSGRPRITTPAEDRHIRVIHLRNRFVTATSTASD